MPCTKMPDLWQSLKKRLQSLAERGKPNGNNTGLSRIEIAFYTVRNPQKNNSLYCHRLIGWEAPTKIMYEPKTLSLSHFDYESVSNWDNLMVFLSTILPGKTTKQILIQNGKLVGVLGGD